MTDGLDRCPTPWCGPKHEKYTWQGPDDLYCVICDGCQVVGPSEETESEAIAAWNTRTTSLAAQDSLVERVARAMYEDFWGSNSHDPIPWEFTSSKDIWLKKAKVALSIVREN